MARKMKCGTCGSIDVVRDAWALWSVEQQKWELSDVSDYAFCGKCDGETTVVEEEIKT